MTTPTSSSSLNRQEPFSATSAASAPETGTYRPTGRGRFARLPEIAGRSFLPIGLIARLPLAMLTVGALTLATAVHDSYSAGGFAAGAVGIGAAVGAPVLGNFADRLGQRPTLIVSAVLNALAIAAFLAVNALPGPATFLLPALVAAFLMGVTCPQIGPLARARWMALTERRRPTDLDTAMSYESTADELTFVLGPALVGVLASMVSPWLPLSIAALLTVIFVSAFAVHPTERSVVPLRRRPSVPAGSPSAVPARARARTVLLVALPVAGMVLMGTFFGSTQTALSAFAGSFEAAASAGLLYSVMGISSALTALSVAYWPQRISHPLRWVVSAGAMSAAALLLFLPQDIPLMLLALLILGLPVGPTMVTIFSIGSLVAPRHLVGTVMTLLASGIVAGTALGASIAGALAEGGGTVPFTVPAAAAVVLLLLGLLSVGLRRRLPGLR